MVGFVKRVQCSGLAQKNTLGDGPRRHVGCSILGEGMVHSSNVGRELEGVIGKTEFNEGRPFVLVQGSPDWWTDMSVFALGLENEFGKMVA